ncbi:MAG: M48 family metalloprotease [Deltaproteobacteria bacterium]|nr:M48 family metalloprotease [Deltaproteobacteria bacterium]
MRVVMVLIAVAVALATVRSARAETKQEIDQRLRAQLEREHPEALPDWDLASAAFERGELERSVTAFQAVIARAPTFDAAFRRMSGPLGALGRIAEARAACETAVKLDDTPLNRAALAEVLLQDRDPTVQRHGQDMARRAAIAAPTDAYIGSIECHAYVVISQPVLFHRCTDQLIAMAPDDPQANLLAAMAAADSGRTDEALRYLARGREALPPGKYQELRDAIESTRTQHGAPGWIWTGLWVLLGWAAGLLLLFVAGGVLSFITLRSVERTATAAASVDGGGQRGLRRVYGLVIAIASAYFYVSIPVVVLSVLGLGAGIIYGIVAAGFIAPKLFLLVVILVGASVMAVLRSLLVKPMRDAPGTRLDLAQHPALRDALDEVADVVGTRPVDAVYLVPGCDVAVSEHRGFRRKAERRLILGVAVLDGMHKGWLKSILAHEYGHFRNQDTAGGGAALAVRHSLIMMTVRLAQSGAAAWFNPAWLFVRLYLGAFLRISQGASRLQEVMADRWAALAYGSMSFDAGFRHVITREAAFDRHVRRVLTDVIDERRPLANFYQHEASKPAAENSEETIEAEITAMMDRPPAPFDSHPAPRQRLAWVAALAAPARTATDDDELAWTLFADRDAIERLMTDQVCANVAKNHGVTITRAA